MDKKRKSPGRAVIEVLSSLKLTVWLLSAAAFIVLAGTLGQRFMGNWQAVDSYFRCFLAWIPLKIFVPETWDVSERIGIWFPGGWAIGTALLINLIAAHSVRFKVKATGRKLAIGLGVIAAGAVLTGLVIYGYAQKDSSLGMQDPYWRVAIQLIVGGIAGAVLLIGCMYVFKDRAGMVLLHAGIILMMMSELFTGIFADEAQMQVGEGETVNWVTDTRSVEVAVINRSDPKFDRVTAVPGSRLDEKRIGHRSLPFELEVPQFVVNADLRQAKPGESNPADTGDGLHWMIAERPPISGVDPNQQVDLPACYVVLKEKESGRKLATVLLSLILTSQSRPQKVVVDGAEYHLYLRFKRSYKPYSVKLLDFRFDRYLGTNQARNYSSDIVLLDPDRKVERKVRIWMNNPLRYRGDTLYQSSFTPDEKGTILQVVSNAGWMVPYVSCMIVATGLLAHFGIMLIAFLRRRAKA